MRLANSYRVIPRSLKHLSIVKRTIWLSLYDRLQDSPCDDLASCGRGVGEVGVIKLNVGMRLALGKERASYLGKLHSVAFCRLAVCGADALRHLRRGKSNLLKLGRACLSAPRYVENKLSRAVGKQVAARRNAGKKLVGVLYSAKAVVLKHDVIVFFKTELLAEEVFRQSEGKRVLDMCTGSGCIAITVAKLGAPAFTAASDYSAEALVVAKKNAELQDAKVRFFQGDLFEHVEGTYDIIVSNPPYITTDEMEQLPDSVKNYEPHLALHGGTDGLDFYRAIIHNYAQALKPGGYMCLEFGMGQGDAVCQILENNGYTILERSRDYNDRERAVLAQLGRKDV